MQLCVCTFFLGRVLSIISITFSNGSSKFIHLTDCAEHKLGLGRSAGGGSPDRVQVDSGCVTWV